MKKLLLISALIFFSSSWTMAQSSQEPPSGMSEIQAYSIFYENYKNESYEGSLQFGRWIWKAMPESIEGYSKFDLKRNLRRLIKVYGTLSTQAEDPSMGQAYTDTALTIFQKVSDKYGDDLNTYDWSLNKGRFYQNHSDYVENAPAKAATEYKKAFDLKPKEFTKSGEGYYIQSLLQSLVAEGNKKEALALVKETESYAPEKVKGYYDNVRNKLFDSPGERITFLEGKLEEDPENVDVLNQLRDLYENQGNNQKLSELNKKLYEVDPSYENSLALGESAMSDARYDEAIEYFKEALDKTEKADQKAAIALNISDAYLNSEQLQSAREYARTAADNDDSWGKPYIQIADIYARTVNQCTNNRELETEDRVVYWLVLDYLSRAKQIDSSVSNEADRKRESYVSVTPSTEQQFFKNWEEGQTLQVNSSLHSCYSWISESTTVRR
jgi:tetratricopeptide (TPR) repeat protein